MKRFYVSRTIAAPAEAVWGVLVDTAAWPRWGPTVSGVSNAPAQLGARARGRVRTIAGVSLPFEVTEWEEGRRWSWRVAGVEATDHVVERVAGGRCRASIGVPVWSLPYLAVCARALANIERLVAP